MNVGDYLAANNLFILLAVLAVAVVALVLFLRKPGNRHPMDGEHGHDLEEKRARMNKQETTDVPPTRR